MEANVLKTLSTDQWLKNNMNTAVNWKRMRESTKIPGEMSAKITGVNTENDNYKETPKA